MMSRTSTHSQKQGYDNACLELADHFLADIPETMRGQYREPLALAIQHAVEGWFAEQENPF